MKPDAILLFAHGSLLCGAGEALQAHAERLRTKGLAAKVEVGYLNYSEPLFGEVVARLAQEGVRRILVLPYFLVPGKFVKTDIPKALEEVKARYPEMEFVVAEPIGYDENLADALIASAFAAVGPEAWREDLERAARFCRASPDCPLYGTAKCPATSGVKQNG
ncbi:sirohydrochlorin chelatase [Chthonomonas calidirosea]|uniref:Uncharacterized conserved protein n=1 Tax=Chthonomonas calidirosea (strain DSM 23976 / ICMP 18418 / T49) TaxID=1303518 RepID=S0EXU8_CHTCT|nr:CbiX/SirB N-terminal domain-containing protein [Chthonomonas calidirosea]CCW35126.1 Uncharacterized conserved protein [Chthonomonas calidirosea T49]CEK20228.1 hypothetical protein CP488_02787 [Chthonomonas calidirosea]CEK20857.1 hypothetical protein CTKA_02791 [Chthonomonas calidirosea]